MASPCPSASGARFLSRRPLLLLGLAIALIAQGAPPYEPQPGDIIFQSFPNSPLTDAIESVTQSPLSHCGLVVRHNGAWKVLEAIGPVTETPLDEWINRGRNRGYVVCRLLPEYQAKIDSFIEKAREFRGRPYDLRYAFDDDAIYCSELVFKAFKAATGEDLGTVRRLGEMNWKPNEAFIRKIEDGGLPLGRAMITPQDLSEAPQLREVFRLGIAPVP